PSVLPSVSGSPHPALCLRTKKVIMGDTLSPRGRLPRWLLVSEPAANSLTHALGLLLSIIGAPFLVLLAQRMGDSGHVAACAVYMMTLILLYAASTRYHMLQNRPGEYGRLIADHCCIYLLIAGTYTAICLTSLRDHGG